MLASLGLVALGLSAGAGADDGKPQAVVSCELKLFLPQLSASEVEAANRLDLETTLLQSQLN